MRRRAAVTLATPCRRPFVHWQLPISAHSRAWSARRQASVTNSHPAPSERGHPSLWSTPKNAGRLQLQDSPVSGADRCRMLLAARQAAGRLAVEAQKPRTGCARTEGPGHPPHQS